MKATSILFGITAAVLCGAQVVSAQEKPNEKYRPKLFAQFGDNMNVLDGLTQNKRSGEIYMSVPNYIDKRYAPVIMRRDEKGQWSICVQALLNETTKQAGPMGIELGPDGNLYYCDNQYFFSKDYQSRIMRVVIGTNKTPVRIEPVIERIKLANAIRFYKDELIFSDTHSDLPNVNHGAVYRVPMSAFKEKPVRLLDKEQMEKDPYFLGKTDTIPLKGRDDNSGADGVCLDKDGNIYTGTFGDAHFYTMKRNADGTYGKPERLYNNPEVWPCCDGICYYPKKNWIIMTDSAMNAVRYWDIAAKKLGLIWQNGDTDGADGLLDQPCEPMIWQGKLLVVNFDWTFPGLMNTSNDKANTISVIDL